MIENTNANERRRNNVDRGISPWIQQATNTKRAVACWRSQQRDGRLLLSPPYISLSRLAASPHDQHINGQVSVCLRLCMVFYFAVVCSTDFYTTGDWTSYPTNHLRTLGIVMATRAATSLSIWERKKRMERRLIWDLYRIVHHQVLQHWIAKTPGRANCLASGLSRTTIPWPPPLFLLLFFFFFFFSHPPTSRLLSPLTHSGLVASGCINLTKRFRARKEKKNHAGINFETHRRTQSCVATLQTSIS